MKMSLRLALVPLAFGLVCSGFIIARPQWVNDFTSSLVNRPDAEEQSDQSRHEARAARTRQSLALKSIIADDLIGQRITFAQAVAEFHELNMTDPSIMQGVRLSFPAETEEESVARQVIQYVRGELGSDRSRMEETVCRLEAEFSKVKGRKPHGAG